HAEFEDVVPEAHFNSIFRVVAWSGEGDAAHSHLSGGIWWPCLSEIKQGMPKISVHLMGDSETHCLGIVALHR
ncbi:hypothetical protein NL501_31120, partial [Klebsiella pneumoniae]|nr:hypothetical protein [Klebsiella pneumoniae]